jgi:hypothetical protein
LSNSAGPLAVAEKKNGAVGPIAIGGVGGSGTRVIASVLAHLGIYIGDDLNDALDNLWFTFFFKRRQALACSDESFQALTSVFVKGMEGGQPFSEAEIQMLHQVSSSSLPEHDAVWCAQRIRALLQRRDSPRVSQRWGWKEPNTHILVRRIDQSIAGLRYVHVVRNGLDMAHSVNQNQMRLWAPLFLGVSATRFTPGLSLKYWRAVHEKILDVRKAMGDRFLLLSYDRLCADPEPELAKLCEFLHVSPSPDQMMAIRQEIRPSAGIGRFRGFDCGGFDPDDVAFVRKMGFEIH